MSARHTISAKKLASVLTATPSPSRLSPHLIVMALVFVGSMVVGYLLLPDDNERIAMLERDGHDSQALEILEQRFAAGDRKQRTLFQLQSLYEEKGDIARATRTLELLAAARPRDANLQRHLAELYRSTQDEPGYIRMLESRLAARFSRPICRELIGRYRGAGDFAAEQRTLNYCRARGYRRTDDIIRLAHLTATDGNTSEAASLLRSVDDRRQLRVDSDRLMLFVALVEEGAAEEAKRRAARWFKGSKDDALVLQMIDTLAASGRHELGVDLAREVGRPGDSISLAIAELMLDRDEIDAARTYLAGWLEHARLRESELTQRALRAALDAEDPSLALKAARGYGLARLQQEDLVSLAEALSAIDQTEEFREVRALIAPGSIEDNLLLAAAVEVEQGKPEPARQLLSRVQVKALDDWRLTLWARLMTSTGRKETAQQTLRDIAAEVHNDDLAPAPAPNPPVEALEPTSPTQAAPAAQPSIIPSVPSVDARSKEPGRHLGQPQAGRKIMRRGRHRATPRRSRWRRAPPLRSAPLRSPTAPSVAFPSPG
ncbi:MAG: hypothetical protein R3D44_13900 [Hyphomicrobiaceae bacterium]